MKYLIDRFAKNIMNQPSRNHQFNDIIYINIGKSCCLQLVFSLQTVNFTYFILKWLLSVSFCRHKLRLTRTSCSERNLRTFQF